MVGDTVFPPLFQILKFCYTGRMNTYSISDLSFLRKQSIVDLRLEGYSIRSIAKLVGYSSPSPVHRFLKSEGLTTIPIDKYL